MTTDITIGRFGSTTDVGLSGWDLDGDQVRAQGYIANTDRALVQMARQRLMGLVSSPDEPVVPVTVTGDATQDGYYMIDGGSVSLDVSRYYAKSYPWSASLTKVINFQQPDIDVRSLGTVRTNVDSFTTGNTSPTVGFPDGTLAVDLPDTTFTTYSTANGNAYVATHADFYDRRTRYRVAPSDYYDAACSVEQNIGGTWYAVTGRQTKAAATEIRVNNGLLRIAAYTDATAALSGIQLESFVSGSTWGAAKTWNFRRSGASLVTAGAQGVHILRNRPEECVIQFTYPMATASVKGILSASVRVRRGHRMADVNLHCGSASVQYVVRNTETLVAATGGYQANANDASSQRVVFARRGNTTLVNTDLDVSYNSATATGVTFGLGVRETGGASLWGTVADTMNRWFAYVGDTQTIARPR